MGKKQRTIGAEEYDRFIITVSKEVGDRIRRLSDKKNVTYSRFIAEIVEAKLDDIETSVDEER